MIVTLLDTNVLISGIFWRGAPRQLIHRARQGLIRVVVCQALLDELEDVLTREGKPFRLSHDEAQAVIKDVLSYAKLVKPRGQVSVCRDPKDNVVLACALGGKARYLVTGDPDLLDLQEFEGIKIVTVREFLTLQEIY
ncbi:MAG: putative toxin-antitoxin system toxin component, PIN family [Chloroflexota bacterium]